MLAPKKWTNSRFSQQLLGEKNSHQAHPDALVEIRRLPGFKEFSSWEFRFVTNTYFGSTDQEKFTHIYNIIIKEGTTR